MVTMPSDDAAQFAFDIETVSPGVAADEYPDFEDSSQFELLASCVAYRESPDAEPETAVFFRSGWGSAAELDVIERTLAWFEARDADAIITYNGDRFDLRHLRGRAVLASEALGARSGLVDRVDAFFGSNVSIDLQPEAWEAWGEYTSLEAACEAAGIDVSSTRLDAYDLSAINLDEQRRARDVGTEHVLGADVPVLGEWFLDLADAGATDTLSFRELRRLFEHYALNDVRPLFALADRRPFVE